MRDGNIVKIVVLGGEKDYAYAVGVKIEHVAVRVRKIIHDIEKNKYTVILDNHQEIEIISNNILVTRQY